MTSSHEYMKITKNFSRLNHFWVASNHIAAIYVHNQYVFTQVLACRIMLHPIFILDAFSADAENLRLTFVPAASHGL